jgi:hypothetical protein
MHWRKKKNTAKKEKTYPTASQSVQIRPADSAVCDFDVDVCFLPRLGLKVLPLHVAVGGAGVKANPALEFVFGAHFG